MEQLLPAQIDAFLAMLQTQRGRSINTIAAYRNDLTQFSTFVQATSLPANDVASPAQNGAGTFDPLQVDQWLDALAATGYAQSSVARKEAALTSFTQWLTTQTDSTPLLRKGGTRQPRSNSPAPVLDAAQIDAVLAHASTLRTPHGLRDNALLQLMAGAGCSASKVVALNLSHLQLDDDKPTLRIGAASMRLSAPVAAALVAYLADGRVHLSAPSEEDALFLNHRGKRLTRQGLWLIVKRQATDAGLTIEVTPQLLRQSFALRQIEKGVEPKKFAEQMGTSPRRSTQDYRRMAKRAKPASIVIDGKIVKP